VSIPRYLNWPQTTVEFDADNTDALLSYLGTMDMSSLKGWARTTGDGTNEAYKFSRTVNGHAVQFGIKIGSYSLSTVAYDPATPTELGGVQKFTTTQHFWLFATERSLVVMGGSASSAPVASGSGATVYSGLIGVMMPDPFPYDPEDIYVNPVYITGPSMYSTRYQSTIFNMGLTNTVASNNVNSYSSTVFDNGSFLTLPYWCPDYLNNMQTIIMGALPNCLCSASGNSSGLVDRPARLVLPIGDTEADGTAPFQFARKAGIYFRVR